MSAPIPGSTRNISVKAGAAPTQVGAITAGSLIVNQSSTTAVWVLGGSNVSPGVGLRIGPLGSITWQPNVATPQVWACVDTGGTAAVTITVSDQAVNPDSPLDVAIALIESGVPVKRVADQLTLTGGLYDVSDYESVSIVVNDVGGAVVPTYNLQDSFGNVIVAGFVACVIGSGVYGTVTPVYGATRLVLGVSGTASVTVVGMTGGAVQDIPQQIELGPSISSRFNQNVWNSGQQTIPSGAATDVILNGSFTGPGILYGRLSTTDTTHDIRVYARPVNPFFIGDQSYIVLLMGRSDMVAEFGVANTFYGRVSAALPIDYWQIHLQAPTALTATATVWYDFVPTP